MEVTEINLPEEFDTIEIFPLSDLHVGDSRMKLSLFKEFIAHILEKPNRYVICNGDLMNNAIKSSVSNVYNESLTPNQQKKWLKKELNVIRDRILVMVDGNHEGRTSKETDQSPTEDISEHLGVPYFQDEACLKITFGQRENSKKRQCYTFYVIHGSGGGKRAGSAINNIELLALGIDADIFIAGHVHKKIGYKNACRKIDVRNNNIIECERLFVYSSHWSEFGGYAARGMFNPSALGTVPIILHAKKKKMQAII